MVRRPMPAYSAVRLPLTTGVIARTPGMSSRLCASRRVSGRWVSITLIEKPVVVALPGTMTIRWVPNWVNWLTR